MGNCCLFKGIKKPTNACGWLCSSWHIRRVVMLFAMPMQSVQKGMSSLTCTAYGCLLV